MSVGGCVVGNGGDNSTSPGVHAQVLAQILFQRSVKASRTRCTTFQFRLVKFSRRLMEEFGSLCTYFFLFRKKRFFF